MKKIVIFFLLIASFVSQAQYKTIIGLDTFPVPSSLKAYSFIATDSTGRLTYIWSVRDGKWVAASGSDSTGILSLGATINGSAISISGSPVNSSSGTFAFAWAGLSNQYVRGNGSLATLSTDVIAIGDPRWALVNHSHLASNISDFTTASRNLFSAGTGLSYNSATGVFSWTGAASGITDINGLSGTSQTLAIDTTYTGAASWSSVGTSHTLRLPARLFTTQTLHTVTTANNTTTNSIIVGGVYVTQSSNSMAELNTVTDGTYYGGRIRLREVEYPGTAQWAEIVAGSLSATRVYTLPDSTGIIPLSVKINGTKYTANANGLIDLGTISGGTFDTTTIYDNLALKENLSNKSTNTSLGTSDLLYPSQNAVKVYADTKETAFTETTQEFTSSTSMSITLSNTPKSGKAEMYYLNGIVIKSSNISRTGTGVTLSGFTRESSDVITAKYSY